MSSVIGCATNKTKRRTLARVLNSLALPGNTAFSVNWP
jgi:hypothetical protein